MCSVVCFARLNQELTAPSKEYKVDRSDHSGIEQLQRFVQEVDLGQKSDDNYNRDQVSERV